MTARAFPNPQANISLAIRQEIQRFESVHPSIYAIYDLIEQVVDPDLQSRIRDHVVQIEDSFVNSQEWTLSRSVPDIKLGVLGSVNSGKSALVHRYLTGSYMQEESPEGGRFKKEVMIDGLSYLLLIRDEGGAPEYQFTHWVDAVIFVFSLENEMSFHTVYNYCAKMAHFRNVAEVPLILVGTQDNISESNPRVIDDSRARKLASDLRRCSYYETCATYGLNVERVFQDACQKIIQSRLAQSLTPTNSRPGTPNHNIPRGYLTTTSQGKSYDSSSGHSTGGSGGVPVGGSNSSHNIQSHMSNYKEYTLRDDKYHKDKDKKHKERKAQSGDQTQLGNDPFLYSATDVHQQESTRVKSYPSPMYKVSGENTDIVLRNPSLTPVPGRKSKRSPTVQKSNSFNGAAELKEQRSPTSTPLLSRKKYSMKIISSSEKQQTQQPPLPPPPREQSRDSEDGNGLPTPSSTPTQSRKNRRRSNLFTKKGEEGEKKCKNGELGSGRSIPIKQGYLYKKSTKVLNKEWKKKYVTLLDNGKLTYHANLHDYMDDIQGKEILLIHTTVKIPGMIKPRGSHKCGMSTNGLLKSQLNDLSQKAGGDGFLIGSNGPGGKLDTPNVKKRHKRAKSSGPKSGQDASQQDDSDGYEFIIVSLDSKQWHFEASSHEEREEWVSTVEQQILASLQCNLSGKTKSRSNTLTDPNVVSEIRSIRGNQVCCDCDMPNPDWASINLGALLCIECSGVHRNLGSHISRVRSLDLDDWPPELVAVMKCIGNILANSVWEKTLRGRPKPSPAGSRDEKEAFIRGKYERKEFLPPLPYPDNPIGQQLIDSIVRDDIRNVLILLAYASPEHVNAPYSKQDARTALHIAAALGNFVYVQLLLWYTADVSVEDHDGRNALFYARTSEVPECIDLLKNAGCPECPTLARRRSQQHAMLPQQYHSLKPSPQPVPVAPPRVPQTPSSGNTTPQQTYGAIYP